MLECSGVIWGRPTGTNFTTVVAPKWAGRGKIGKILLDLIAIIEPNKMNIALSTNESTLVS